MSDTESAGGRLGYWFAIWAVLIAGLVWFLDGKLDQQRNPNYRPDAEVVGGERIVRLQRNRAGQYHVLATVNGKPVEFLVDTGASGVILPADFAEREGLPKGQVFQTYTANGIGRAYETEIQSLVIGSIQLGPMRAAVAENMPGGYGLLGMTALRQLDFSQRDGELILRQAF